jgi:hypothetical protein
LPDAAAIAPQLPAVAVKVVDIHHTQSSYAVISKVFFLKMRKKKPYIGHLGLFVMQRRGLRNT